MKDEVGSMHKPTIDELSMLHANICQALGDPKRIQILYALDDQSLNVSALADHLNTPQPTISRHLRVLRQRALVVAERKGPAVIYRLADKRMIEILNEMRVILRDAVARQSEMLTEGD